VQKMPVLNTIIVAVLGAGFMALAIAMGLMLRRALETGVLVKGYRLMPGKWSRAKSPVKFKLMWGLGAVTTSVLFINGAFFFVGSLALAFGY
jgi:hypothetical protein